MSDLSFNNLFLQMPGVVTLKDLKSRYLAVNQRMLQYIGFKKDSQLIGKSDDFFHDNPELLLLQDSTVRREKKEISIFDIIITHHNTAAYFLTVKKPVFNEDNELFGSLAHSLELSNKTFTYLGQWLSNEQQHFNSRKKSNYSYTVVDKFDGFKLSKRESQCLFYLIRGKSSKMIANILGVSKRTIDSYIDIVKIKMNCQNRYDIVEKAISLGYLFYLPEVLISGKSNNDTESTSILI